MPAPDPRTLQTLRERIRRIEAGGAQGGTANGGNGALPFGIAAMDAHLPGGGLARNALHEVSGGGPDGTHAAAAALFAAGILARLKGPVLWALARRDLFAPGLAGAGLHPDRVVYAEAGDEATILLVMEEGLRHRGLAGVVGELARLPMNAGRRLQLAAEASGTPALVLRRWRGPSPETVPAEPGAVTRWRITALPAPSLSNPFRPVDMPGLGRARWRVELLRCRGAEPAQWILEACDAQGRLAVPADLADGPAAAEGRRASA